MHVTISTDAESAFMGALSEIDRDGNRTDSISRVLFWFSAQTKPVREAVLRSGAGAGAATDDVGALRRHVSFAPVPPIATLHVHRRVSGGTVKTASLKVEMPEDMKGFGPGSTRQRKGGDPPAKEGRPAPRKSA